MRLPVSKSHAHRVLIAEFLAGRLASLAPSEADCDDVAATKRCLGALASGASALDCGESGTTRRLLGPVAAALGIKAEWIMRGRLASRPQIEYPEIAPGVHELPGDVSSQFVSGLLFALPVLRGDSEIVLTSPLKSRGYVDMTLGVLREYGISVVETDRGFRVPGSQGYTAPAKGPRIEGDWSSAAFALAMNALGSEVQFADGGAASLLSDSLQPDRAVVRLLDVLSGEGERMLDVDQCPDLFPVMAVVAACRKGRTAFGGTRRLRLKESDRIDALQKELKAFGADVTLTATELRLPSSRLHGATTVCSHSDHRIAMAFGILTLLFPDLVVQDPEQVTKSFPDFWQQLDTIRKASAQHQAIG